MPAHLIHRRLLDEAVQASGPIAEALRGRPVLVTGASGFLASSLLAYLAELNRVHGAGLRLHASARRPVADVRLFPFLGLEPAITWQPAPAESTRLPDEPGLIVVHTASFGSPKDYLREPLATFRANTDGLVHLHGQAVERRAAHVVYFSSAEVYGQPPDDRIPTPEAFSGTLDLQSPRSIYGESKRMAEVLGASLSAAGGIPFTAVRPWNLYGPGQRVDDGRVPVEFIRQARTDGAIRLASNGTPRRSFCHVWDGIRQIASVLAPEGPAPAAWNIGQGATETSVLELARACARAGGRPESAVTYDPQARAAGLQRCSPDVSAVSRRAGTPSTFTPLDTGLATLVEWFEFLERK